MDARHVLIAGYAAALASVAAASCRNWDRTWMGSSSSLGSGGEPASSSSQTGAGAGTSSASRGASTSSSPSSTSGHSTSTGSAIADGGPCARPELPPVPIFGMPAPLDGVNSGEGDTYGPAITGDGLELLFASDWPVYESMPTLRIQAAKRDTAAGAFMGTTSTISALHVTDVSEGDPTIDYDGLFLVYSTERTGGYGARDLWMSVRTSRDAQWQQPTHLDALSTIDDESSPSLSADGNTILFARGPSDTTADTIFIATREDGGDWGTPHKIAELEVPGRMTDYSTLFPDGRTIVFASDRDTPGTHHLFLARRTTADGTFECVQRLGGLLSKGFSDEISPTVSRDGKKLFYAAIMTGDGLYNVYQSAILPPQ